MSCGVAFYGRGISWCIRYLALTYLFIFPFEDTIKYTVLVLSFRTHMHSQGATLYITYNAFYRPCDESRRYVSMLLPILSSYIPLLSHPYT